MVSFPIDKIELSDEHYLTALLSVKDMSESQKSQAIDLSTRIDTEIFQVEAIEHRVCGLVMNNIQKLNLFENSSYFQISKKANEQVFDSLNLSRELIRINQKFNEKNLQNIITT